jgi:hypothetical protein
MSCFRVFGHVFILLANHLLTKMDVLTAIYIIRGLILVCFSHLQKSYNLHLYLHLIFDTLLCSSRLTCEAVQESQVISPYVVCTIFIALGTVLHVRALRFSETLILFLYQTVLHHVPGDTLQRLETGFIKRMRVTMSYVNCQWTKM